MRVFLPATNALLRTLHEQQHAPAPLAGHAVTPAARAAWPEAEDDELDYAVLVAAAYDSLLRLAADAGPASPVDRPRRLVVVADVPDAAAAPLGGEEVTAVVVTADVGLAQVAALYADDPDAADDVRAAVRLVPGATVADGDPPDALLLPDHELMWFAAQELPDLLA